MVPTTSLPKLDGVLLSPGTDAYEEARSRNFAENAHEGRAIANPPYIAVVKSVPDIQACLQFATSQGLKVTVRSGGHNWFGCYLRKDALLVDMQHFDKIQDLDVTTKTVSVGPNVLGNVLNEALAEHDLCFSTGHCTGVPVGGFLLGGGLGWFVAKYGFAAESVEAIKLVDAKGNLIEATDDNDLKDWMWLARGSANAFPGIVVSFKLKVHPKPKIIKSRQELHPIENFEKVSNFIHNFLQAQPVELTSSWELTMGLICTPPPLAEVIKAPKILMFMVCCVADTQEEFEKAFNPLQQMPSTPYLPAEFVDHDHYGSLADLLSDAFPSGMHWITRTYETDLAHYEKFDWDILKDAYLSKAPMGLSHFMVVLSPERPVTKPSCLGSTTHGIAILTVGVHSGDASEAAATNDYVDAMDALVDPITEFYDVLEHPLNKETFHKCFTGTANEILLLRSKLDPDKLFFDASGAEPSH